MKLFISLLVILLILPVCLMAQVSFEASVDKVEAAFEDQIRLELLVKVTDPAVRTTPLLPKQIAGFHLGGSGSSVERSGDTILRRYTYQLLPERSGVLTIPPVGVEFSDSLGTDTLVSEAIRVTIAQPVPLGEDGATPLWLVVVSLVLIVVGASWWYRRSLKVVRSREADWRDGYREKLTSINLLCERENYTAFSTEAIKLVVSLLEKVYDTRLAGRTAAELIQFLRDKGVGKATLDYFREFSDFCEVVKFSSGTVDRQAGGGAAVALTKMVEPFLK